jgi:hypothetical protein
MASEAVDAVDKATAPKRISAFLKLCVAFVPCDHFEYDETVKELSDEVDDDLDAAKFTLKRVEEKVVPTLVKLECDATSVLLQVLYALHRGHVQFLMADYKSRILEAYPHAFAKVRPPKLGKDGLPKGITDVGSTVNTKASDNTVDMSGVDDDEGEISDIDPNNGAGSEANTFTSSTSQKELRPPKERSATPSENSEAAGFGSDTSPRKDTGDNDELDQAEDN